MPDNYQDTAYRMYDSSHLLFQKKQWFNANYLSGYILECYCKLVLTLYSQHGYSFSRGHSTLRSFGHKLSDLKNEIDLISLSGCAASSYCLDILSTCPNTLNEWDPKRRYEPDCSTLNTKTLAEKIHMETESLIDMIMKMDIDGVII